MAEKPIEDEAIETLQLADPAAVELFRRDFVYAVDIISQIAQALMARHGRSRSAVVYALSEAFAQGAVKLGFQDDAAREQWAATWARILQRRVEVLAREHAEAVMAREVQEAAHATKH